MINTKILENAKGHGHVYNISKLSVAFIVATFLLNYINGCAIIFFQSCIQKHVYKYNVCNNALCLYSFSITSQTWYDNHCFSLSRLYTFLNLNVTYNRKYMKYIYLRCRHHLFIFSLYSPKKITIIIVFISVC